MPRTVTMLAVMALLYLANKPVAAQEKPAVKPGGDLWVLQVWNVEGKTQRDASKSHSTWLGELLIGNSKGVFAHAHHRILSGDDATRDGILDGLAWLKKNMKDSDTGVFSISCHGGATKHGWNGAVHPMGDGKKHPFTSKDLVDALTEVKGKVIVMVGSCASGGILEQEGLDRLPNVVIIAACKKDEGSSGALVPFAKEGWSGAADSNHDSYVDSLEIAEYLAKHHPAKFTPVFYHPKDLPAFSIVKVTQSGNSKSKPAK